MLEKDPEAFRIISEVAEDLNVPQHVLRFWESRFPQIKPMKRGGGRRYYRPDDVDLLRGIRHLLYGEGYTIRGVQRILREQGVGFVQDVWQEGAPQPTPEAADAEDEGQQPDRGGPDRGGLLGRLPGLFRSGGGEDDEMSPAPRREPMLDATSDPADEPPLRQEPEEILPAADDAAQSHPPAGLSGDQLHQLEAALHQLTECRRKLDEAMDDRL
jgi:DNA-binding transcriptional MerR regulator